eukprot:c45986_g1_i1.p1 GENE.c45986_g1_i1~~c45986_g1_i1.p1  ORF type:complete len:314 (+),score=48.02 c45986_g1_i1:48-989(+)
MLNASKSFPDLFEMPGCKMRPTPLTHEKCRGDYPRYPKRTDVPDDLVSWDIPWPEYAPIEFTHPKIFENDRTQTPKGYADPVRLSPEELHARKSFCGFSLDAEGMPLNPVGRTGMKGRGGLGLWGPNHAADPIVTRINPINGQLEMVVIKRQDSGVWAIPGGMVEEGESVSSTLRREFGEEALNTNEMTPRTLTKVTEQVRQMFCSGTLLFAGYVDDARNTDNAWLETNVAHFHLPREVASKVKLVSGDDAGEVRWLCLDDNATELNLLWASHKDFVEMAIDNYYNTHKTGCFGRRRRHKCKRQSESNAAAKK